MTDGINLTGFAEIGEQTGPHPIDATGDYAPADGSFPAAQDKSTQDGSGLGNGGK